MNEPLKNRVTVYEAERFCERLHKLIIETHPSLGQPSFDLQTGTLRVTFPEHEPEAPSLANSIEIQPGPGHPEFSGMQTLGEIVKPRKSKKAPQ